MRVKRIVHVLPYMSKGGTEKHVLTLLRGFRDRYRCTLLAPRGEILGEFLKLGVEYVEFPELKGNVLKKIGVFKERLRSVHARGSVDLVHIHAAHEFAMFTRRVLPSVPIIFHLSAHQGSALSRYFNYTLSARISRKKADLLIAVSEEEKRIITARGFPPAKTAVVYNGYEMGEGDDLELIARLKKTHGLENKLILGNLGRFNLTKRLDLLIESFALLRKDLDAERRAPMKLLLIGEGPDGERLRGLVKNLGIEEEVVFPGFIPRGDRVLKIFDVFVLPTTFEGCSNVLVEAMAKGLPIVTTDIPSVSWMFKNGEQAMLFRKNSVDDLFFKLKELVDDAPRREKLGRNAFLNYKNRFSAQTMVEKVDEIYRQLLS